MPRKHIAKIKCKLDLFSTEMGGFENIGWFYLFVDFQNFIYFALATCMNNFNF